MSKRSVAVLLTALALAGCASSAPRVIQAKTGSEEINLKVGMAAQVEMPSEGRVQAVVVGDPSIVSAEQAGEAVNLIAKGGPGETNLIIRSKEDGATKVYQYKVIVEPK